jgi:hypothetical protein
MYHLVASSSYNQLGDSYRLGICSSANAGLITIGLAARNKSAPSIRTMSPPRRYVAAFCEANNTPNGLQLYQRHTKCHYGAQHIVVMIHLIDWCGCLYLNL